MPSYDMPMDTPPIPDDLKNAGEVRRERDGLRRRMVELDTRLTEAREAYLAGDWGSLERALHIDP